jgi:Co/Zn/Cd efflux system component
VALLGVTGYVTNEAIMILLGKGDDDDVNVYFLWAFSSGNFLVDLISSYLFYLRGSDGLVSKQEEHAPLRTFSLDRQSTNMEKRNPLAISIPNLNMLSALTHVGGDTLRTISVFIAALVSTAGGVDGSLCDAWATTVVSFSIVICVIPLCKEIYKAYWNIPDDGTDKDGEHEDEEAILNRNSDLSRSLL